jgi:hypothetical protein
MKLSAARWFLGALPWLLVAPACQAVSDHEMRVGAQKEQLCEQRTLGAVARFLHVDGVATPRGAEGSVLVAAACKRHPADRRLMIAAVAFEGGDPEGKSLALVFLDEASGEVRTSYRGTIQEDAAMRVESGSLWIDTARYDLRPGVRAIGLDVKSGHGARCADGSLGAVRSLYVARGKALAPVLEGLMMSNSMHVEGFDGCELTGNEVNEYTDRSIALGDTVTNGYRDLVISVVTTRDDGKKPSSKPHRLVLKFDGQRYPLDNELP